MSARATHAPVAAAARVPTRTCVACRTEPSEARLVRVVRTPDGTVVARRRPAGWPAAAPISAPTAPAGRSAIKKGALERALATPLPAELRESRSSAATIDDDIEGGAHGQE